MPWPSSLWSDDKIDALTRMVADGIPFRLIGPEIGMTRNACIGKARRVGLQIITRETPWKGDPDYVNQKIRNKQAAEERRRAKAALQDQLKKVKERTRPEERSSRFVSKSLPPRPVAAPVSFEPLNLTMDQLSLPEFPIQCRYICNDDMSALLYCGHQTHKGTSWCAFHHARVFTPRVPKVNAQPVYKARAA